MERLEFIEDQASQRLYFFAEEGRPSAKPTVEIKDSGGTVLTAAASTYVTQDTVTTTIGAAAAAGSSSVTVASATGITVGKRYLLTNKIGQTEWVEVESVASTTVTFTAPLQRSFATLSTNYGTFESTEWYYTLQSTDYSALAEMHQAKTVYTAGGLSRTQRVTFDIVRVPLVNALTADELFARWPDIWRQEGAEHRGSSFKRQRETAWQIVKQRIRQHGNAAGQWRPAMVFDRADLMQFAFAVLKRELHLAGVEVDKDQPTREMLDKEVDREQSLAFASITMDLDEDEAQGAHEIPRHELDFIR
jgi:hypothetical protein